MTELIARFVGDESYLSNFYYAPIQVDGIAYDTVEHAFQAAKTFDRAQQVQIAHAPSPSVAKRMGRRADLRPDWDQVKVKLMAQLLLIKFGMHENLGRKLAALDGVQLVEGNNWHDQFWGNCYCPRHQAKPGLNMLGQLLMALQPRIHATFEHETNREGPQ